MNRRNAYRSGHLEILKLREEARRRLGDRFDIKGWAGVRYAIGPHG
jgi:uncharacterized protein (DUF885 family)